MRRFALLLPSSLAESSGHAVPCVCDLQKEIATFLRQKNLSYANRPVARISKGGGFIFGLTQSFPAGGLGGAVCVCHNAFASGKRIVAKKILKLQQN